MSNITEIGKDFKDIAEAKVLNNALTKNVIQLTKKIKTLEDENSHLKDLLANSMPVVQQAASTGSNVPSLLVAENSDEEGICRMQIRRLHEISMNGELTLEECRKLEVYTKLLMSLQNKPKVIEVKNLKDKSDNELLSMLSEEQ